MQTPACNTGRQASSINCFGPTSSNQKSALRYWSRWRITATPEFKRKQHGFGLFSTDDSNTLNQQAILTAPIPVSTRPVLLSIFSPRPLRKLCVSALKNELAVIERWTSGRRVIPSQGLWSAKCSRNLTSPARRSASDHHLPVGQRRIHPPPRALRRATRGLRSGSRPARRRAGPCRTGRRGRCAFR